MREGLAARQAAARLLAAIVEKRTSADGLTDEHGGHPQFLALAARDRALVRAILAAALRHRLAIAALIDQQLERPLPAGATALHHILHVALAQMLFLDVPARAAVDLAVEHAGRDPRTRRFARLVNAVLRGIQRLDPARRDAIIAGAPRAPDWFAAMLERDYGSARAEAILAAQGVPAPLDLTVRSDPGQWAERLGGIVLPTGSVRLGRFDGPVSALPGFADGQWWVQDAAAAIPARLLGPVDGLAVVDLCAAPGGKSAQLAHAGARLTAVERVPARLKRLEANFARLGFKASLVQADLFDFAPAQPFDAVLLDAPCSSTGTVRRHPDIPWTKGPEDIAKLAGLQRRMLEHAIGLVRPGGLIVFANCSLARAEGEALAAAFADHPALEPAPVRPGEFPDLDPYLGPEGHVRTIPADLVLDRPELSGLDGFFAARFRRRPGRQG